MRSPEPAGLARVAVVAALASAALGCAAAPGPPAIRLGVPCAACGMEIQDTRFACERGAGREWRVYDSIECLLRDAGPRPEGRAFLADYDTRALHAAESLWVVRGTFASPMGGGFAAFLDRAGADDVASRTGGRVARLDAFAAGGGEAER